MKQRLLTLLLALTSLGASAQILTPADTTADTDRNLLRAALKGWHVQLGAGFNVGGTTPLPLPREIRAIRGYSPELNISLQGAVQKDFTGSFWGLLLGVRLEGKGMRTRARVKNYHVEAVNADGTGKVVGAWTGSVKTQVANNYITFPLLATYRASQRWQLAAGPYFSYMTKGEFSGEAYDGYIRNEDPTGEKTYVTSATYDFSSSLRRFAWGLEAGASYRAYRHLCVSASLQWGLNGIFHNNFQSVTFDLYPVYGNLGFTYLF